MLFKIETMAGDVRDFAQHPYGLLRHFRPDAVARKDDNSEMHNFLVLI